MLYTGNNCMTYSFIIKGTNSQFNIRPRTRNLSIPYWNLVSQRVSQINNSYYGKTRWPDNTFNSIKYTYFENLVMERVLFIHDAFMNNTCKVEVIDTGAIVWPLWRTDVWDKDFRLKSSRRSLLVWDNTPPTCLLVSVHSRTLVQSFSLPPFFLFFYHLWSQTSGFPVLWTLSTHKQMNKYLSIWVNCLWVIRGNYSVCNKSP